MAKKSSKSSRRVRTAKKVQADKSPRSTKQPKSVAPQSRPDGSIDSPHLVNNEPETSQTVVEEMVQPQRRRMLLSAMVLGVVIVVLIFAATIIRQPDSGNITTSNGDSSKADEILQSGGSVCTNGSAQTDPRGLGSTNPQSVGMMLQNNPSNTIQTPQTTGEGSDVATLQGAACF